MIQIDIEMPEKTGMYLCKIKCPKGEWTEILYWNGEDWFTDDIYNELATPYVVEWQPYKGSDG